MLRKSDGFARGRGGLGPGFWRLNSGSWILATHPPGWLGSGLAVKVEGGLF
jgi:hypothetical protein